MSLASNLRRLVEARVGAAEVSVDEGAALSSALLEALSFLQAGGEEVRSALLARPFASALLEPSAAQLWASALEALGGEVASVSAAAGSITDAVSAVAASLFTASVMD